MNLQEYRTELIGVTTDMNRDTGKVPTSDVYLWYVAVGSDDDYLHELFCESWNDKNAGLVAVSETEVTSINAITPDMCRHILVTMYVLQHWPDSTVREVQK
jgi:hypothetical protein